MSFAIALICKSIADCGLTDFTRLLALVGQLCQQQLAQVVNDTSRS